ncbi:recombination regulator RecX [Clostridium drakei]|uniref:Regulatory protein RecX n=1 Tax=Clostridium drakei TaxID=332101 RepID=A0A2U8DWE2_9CLOT|nr:recombination regulator RecX [Clostridium drakei]AWI06960.1 recombination regulator RecX [Clostridium drakei]
MEDSKKIITKVEIQKRNKDRVNVYINHEFAFACSAELVYIHNIEKGKSVDLNYLNQIVMEDNYIKCKSSALKIIEKVYKTQAQIYSKLLEKEYDEKTVVRTIEFLKKYGFINDEKFVQMYIKDKLKSSGRNKIKYDLIKKGIDEKKINEGFACITSGVEKETATELAEKKYNLLIKNEKDYRKIYKKLGEFLIRKGYNSDIVSETLNNVIKKDVSDFEKKDETHEDEQTDLDKLHVLAEKRYNIIIKSEKDYKKIYKKLGDYLLRRGYSWENIKTVLSSIVNNEDSYI